MNENLTTTIYTTSDASNHIRVIALGNRGWLFINRKFVSALDLVKLEEPGDIVALTAYFVNNSMEGYSTVFQDFIVYSLDQ